MTSLYVANTTKQGHDFIFRLPETQRTTMLHIPAGHQIRLMRDASPSDVDYVVKQHEKYGLVSQAEAAKAKHRYIGLVYGMDEPVKLKNMEIVYKRNDEELRKLAETNLATQGAAIHKNLSDLSREARGKDEVKRVETTIEEQGGPGKKAPEVDMGTENTRGDVAPKEGRRRKVITK